MQEYLDTDVIIAGGGPTGLMLAAELCLAGVRPVVLERLPSTQTTAKAYGLGGQILQLLDYRGVLQHFESAAARPSRPAPGFPFGNLHVDCSDLPDPPLRTLALPQAQLQRLLEARARELGTLIRRGNEVVGVRQHDADVTVDVAGTAGPYRMRARYIVGCDGAHSRVREMAGLEFPGISYPEVNRLGEVTVRDSATRLSDGALDVPGLGIIRPGFTQTERGLFAFGWLTRDLLLIQTTETDVDSLEDDVPMTLTELADSVRRVLGVTVPLHEPTRLSRYRFHARQVERYRDRRILLAGDAAHLFPATGSSLNVGLLDAVNLAWKLAAEIQGSAPKDLLDTYHTERHFAGARTMLQTQAQAALRRGHDAAADALRKLFLELLIDEQPLRRMGALIAGTDIRYAPPDCDDNAFIGSFVPNLTLHTEQGSITVAQLMRKARPILLDLAGRQDLRDVARDWQHRVDVHVARSDRRPVDALLIRPDAHIAWAAAINEPSDNAQMTLRRALCRWFGAPQPNSEGSKVTIGLRIREPRNAS